MIPKCYASQTADQLCNSLSDLLHAHSKEEQHSHQAELSHSRLCCWGSLKYRNHKPKNIQSLNGKGYLVN